MTKSLCLTVDVDRDVNIPVPGKTEAGSADRGGGTSPRYSSSAEGLGTLTNLLDEMGINATYFAEGRTLMNIGGELLEGREVGIHGMDHEDFTQGIPAKEKRRILEESYLTVKDILNANPLCSRMPYMKMSVDIPESLKEIGIKYDSSEYRPLEEPMLPYNLGGLTEVPVPTCTDADGKKIVGYLWPMHEGKRKPSDYAYMASKINRGIFVLATHSWHMAESVDRGTMSEKEKISNADNVRKVIELLLDDGYVFETVPDAVQRISRAP